MCFSSLSLPGHVRGIEHRGDCLFELLLTRMFWRVYYGSTTACEMYATGPPIQETNLDFLNLDISEKDIVDGARKVKCDCTWEVLEWTLFEILVVALLLIIFGYLFMSDGVSHLRKYLKKRNTDENRLQRELSELESKQNKLKKKMGKGTGTAQAPTQPIGEAEQSLSAL